MMLHKVEVKEKLHFIFIQIFLKKGQKLNFYMHFSMTSTV